MSTDKANSFLEEKLFDEDTIERRHGYGPEIAAGNICFAVLGFILVGGYHGNGVGIVFGLQLLVNGLWYREYHQEISQAREWAKAAEKRLAKMDDNESHS